MKIIETGLEGLKIIEVDRFGDHRGWFSETYTKSKFHQLGIYNDFIQDNQSFSAHKNTLRGIHFQNNPKAQTKLIRCTRGTIIDTVVDLRRGSDTYLQSYSVELSAENGLQFLIPKGFGHAFLTLTDDVEVQYKVDEYYSKEHDRSIRFNDSKLNINWHVQSPILSDKDLNAPFLDQSDYNFSLKVLVTGFKGQLGFDVVKQLELLHIDVKGVDIDDFDLTNEEQVTEYVETFKPDIIVHCAAYTQVDKAEENKELCYNINVNGTKYLVNSAAKIDAKFVYISTDYIFDGTGNEPHRENEKINPINYYGYTKAQGELYVTSSLKKYYIIRTSWVYGSNGNNFVKTMLKLSETKKQISVVSDQIGAPTYTVDLAKLIIDLIQTRKYGIYHGVNSEFCSWNEFAKEILALTGKDVEVSEVLTKDYVTLAKRPLNSRLSKQNLINNGISLLPSWKDALVRYLKEINVYKGE